MNYYEIAPMSVVRNDQSCFTYVSDLDLQPGHLVRIPVGKKQVNGIVIRAVSKPSFETKAVLKLIEQRPLPLRLVKLSEWLSEYYTTHTALVLQTILPSGLQKSRRSSADISG